MDAKLKNFLDKNFNLNPNVIYPMIDKIVANGEKDLEEAVEAVIEDVDTYKKVATPVADPVAGEVAAETEVSLTCETEGSVIYYTIDGTEPDDEVGILYENPIVLEEALTIKAIAYKGYQTESDVLESAYTIAE